MSQTKAASIIMAVCNQLAYTRLSIRSILENTATPFEIVIVDNGSRPEIRRYCDSLKGSADVIYIRNESNLGPIRAINQGIQASRHEYICAIHNDVIIFERDWLGRVIGRMERLPEAGIVGLAGRKEIYRNGCVNEATLMHNLQNEDLNPPMAEEISAVAVVDGMCLIFKREILKKVQGLDETYGYMHCYDLDLSLQAVAAGLKNFVINIEAMHIGNGGITRKTTEYKRLVRDDYGLLKKNCRIFSRKWRHLLPLRVD